MRIAEKINIAFYKTTKLKRREIWLLGRPVFKYFKKDDKSFSFDLPNKTTYNDSVFYLKINKISDYTLPCIQHWINIIPETSKIIFICDNFKLRRMIIKTLSFKCFNFEFITSMRNYTRKMTATIATKYWRKATDAHLTSFVHAKKNGYSSFWTIDADDTMILQDPESIYYMLMKVENHAFQNKIDAFSLDMWRSRTHGQHWSFGITFISDNNKVLPLLENNPNIEWSNTFKDLDVAFNLDWFFNYLSLKKQLSVKSFYFDNYYFIHWGNFIRNCIGSSICFWNNGCITYPIMKYIFHSEQLGILPIADCVKFTDKTSLGDGIKFLENEVPITHYFPPEIRRLHSMGDFGTNTKYWY